VGRVIGSHGSMIKELIARSGARIQVDQQVLLTLVLRFRDEANENLKVPDGQPRKISIAGIKIIFRNSVLLIDFFVVLTLLST
jgi:KH domain